MQEFLSRVKTITNPLAAIIVILYIVFQFVSSELKDSRQSYSSIQTPQQVRLRDDFDSKMIEILQSQATSIATLTKIQQNLESIMMEDQQSLRRIERSIGSLKAERDSK